MSVRSVLATLVLSASLATFSPGAGSIARAEIDGGSRSYGLYENGVLVGEVYRQDTDPSRYTEHWILYPGYVYPSERNGVALIIRPNLSAYRDLADFFARVPFSPGSRYIATSCADGPSLPGR